MKGGGGGGVGGWRGRSPSRSPGARARAPRGLWLRPRLPLAPPPVIFRCEEGGASGGAWAPAPPATLSSYEGGGAGALAPAPPRLRQP
jgi:hypothetical protein